MQYHDIQTGPLGPTQKEIAEAETPNRAKALHLLILKTEPRSRAELYALCCMHILSSQWVEIKPRMFGGYVQGVTVAICSTTREGRTTRIQVTPRGECYAVFAMTEKHPRIDHKRRFLQ